MDAPIYKKSIAALRCFKRATEIDDSNAKLWLEYGTLAYQLHAHASKQIRWVRVVLLPFLKQVFVLTCRLYKSLENTVEKGKNARNFSFSNCVFNPSYEQSL